MPAGAGEYQVLTPADLPVAATDTQAGLLELATQGEVASGASGALAVTPTGLIPYLKGYIQGASYTWLGVTQYRVEPGEAIVNGALLSWTSPISRTPAIVADTLYYIYLYGNAGVAAVEESTTAPVWDATHQYYRKGADAARRCLGFFHTNATPSIRRFDIRTSGRSREFRYLGDAFTILTAGNNDTAWTSFSAASYVPVHATHCYGIPKILYTNAGEMLFGISPVDLGTQGAGSAPFIVRARQDASATLFFGAVWLPLGANSTMFYRATTYSGTNSAYFALHGARFDV